MVIGDRLVIDGKPGPIRFSDQLAVFGKLIAVVQSKVHKPFAVVIENVDIQPVDQIPLVFRQADGVGAVILRAPDKLRRIELILLQRLDHRLFRNASAAETVRQHAPEELCQKVARRGRRTVGAASRKHRER